MKIIFKSARHLFYKTRNLIKKHMLFASLCSLASLYIYNLLKKH